MLSHFPTPRPDELLYSILGRYHNWSRNKSYSNTIEDVFGKNKLAAVVDFPIGLKNLCGQLSLGTSITPERLIQNNTLFPLFRPFLSKERVRRIERCLIMGGREGNKVHASIGIGRSNQLFSNFLRYCPVCYKTDIENFGEAFWHRSHQIDAVKLCALHSVHLIESNVPFRDREHKYRLTDLNSLILQQQGNDKTIEVSDYDLFIAQSVHWLLNNKITMSGMEDLRARYLNKLKEMGYATTSGIVRLDSFTNNFIDHYGSKYLSNIGCALEQNGDKNWLRLLVRKQVQHLCPMWHILMMGFLGFTPQGFFSSEPEFKPFAEGPWPCLNPAADHYKESVVKHCIVKTNYSNSGSPLGTFYCECGFVYTRLGPEKTTCEKFMYRDIRQFGNVWEQEVVRLVKCEGISLRKVAKKLNTCYHTVRKYLDKNLSIPLAGNCNQRFESIKMSYRSRWLVLQEQFPEKTKTQLSRANAGLYSWLSQRDRIWLHANSPVLQKPKKHSLKNINWAKRDEQLFIKVKKAIEEIIQSPGKPVRITMNLIGNKTHSASLLARNLNRLPKTRDYLLAKVESVEKFQIRRVEYVTIMLKLHNKTVSAWKIRKYANLEPYSISKAVQFQIDQIVMLNEINND